MRIMILQPTGDNIVLLLPKPEAKKEEKTSSGIILMANKTEQNSRKDIADVVAVGEGRRLNNGELLPMSVKAGDKILFNKYAGTEVIIEENVYLIIKECDVLAIIK